MKKEFVVLAGLVLSGLIVGSESIKVNKVEAVDVVCEWCGNECRNINADRDIPCAGPDVPAGATCTNVNGICTGTIPINCGWCGFGCIDRNKDPTIMCAMVMPPEGSTCGNENGTCVGHYPDVTPTILPAVTLTPTETLIPLPNNECGSCPSGIPGKELGNANCDSKIDFLDFSVWRQEYFDQNGIEGTEKSDWRSNFSCDTGSDKKVSMEDFVIWLNNCFGPNGSCV